MGCPGLGGLDPAREPHPEHVKLRAGIIAAHDADMVDAVRQVPHRAPDLRHLKLVNGGGGPAERSADQLIVVSGEEPASDTIGNRHQERCSRRAVTRRLEPIEINVEGAPALRNRKRRLDLLAGGGRQEAPRRIAQAGALALEADAARRRELQGVQEHSFVEALLALQLEDGVGGVPTVRRVERDGVRTAARRLQNGSPARCEIGCRDEDGIVRRGRDRQGRAGGRRVQDVDVVVPEIA